MKKNIVVKYSKLFLFFTVSAFLLLLASIVANQSFNYDIKMQKEDTVMKQENDNFKMDKWNDNSEKLIEDLKFNNKMQNGTNGGTRYSYTADNYMIIVEQEDDSESLSDLKVALCVMKDNKCDAKNVFKNIRLQTENDDIDAFLTNVDNVKHLLQKAL